MARADTPKLVFEAVGSHGDVLPLLTLAARMVERGYEAHLLANAMFASEAERQGVRFTATATRTVNLLPGEVVHFDAYVFPGFEAVRRFFERVSGNVVAVNLTRNAASNLLCERYGVPVLRNHLSPYVFRSLESPPWPLRAKAEGRMGELFRSNVLPRIYHELDTNRPLLDYINERRRALGLSGVTSAAHPEPQVQCQIASFPSWFAAPASDWPRGLECVGFPLPKSPQRLPPELARFIAARGAPIVFTPGTSVSQTRAFAELARACCEKLNRPGVLLSQHHQASACGSDGPLTAFKYVDLDLLLPHAALLVHHGGIGTVARALQAGLPQIILPTGFDQPDNAQRVRLLGVGTVVERHNWSATALADAARELWARAGVDQRLRELSIKVCDGVERAADILESLARTSSKACRAPHWPIPTLDTWS